VLELVVSPRFEPRPLKAIGAPADVIVGAIIRGSEVIVPRGDDQIAPGDHIIVFSTREAAERVQAYFNGFGA
jgi:trk system potassium uptake protein TrkA